MVSHGHFTRNAEEPLHKRCKTGPALLLPQIVSNHNCMSIYPPKVAERVAALAYAGQARGTNAVGTAANFSCGSFVRFYLAIGRDDRIINEVRFASNGCGYATAAADRIAQYCTGRSLTELGGLAELLEDAEIEKIFGPIPPERQQCLEICADALRSALADFRALQIEEFVGEKALICTCFGIDEESIERVITKSSIRSVADVTATTNAGAGCGSCRMLIQEMIDSRERNR